ncbi:ParB/RepB/Spo0J family partition protein [Micromonospora sp. HUAS YX12]|uniref:ParB/RepB/Spo0J family partition protein n=1 Tax=Micromonospora sp. HUAS YX12 TaxID=3156396 RepID=A0AAU7R1X6_9ACTN
MKVVRLDPDQMVVSQELSRSGSAKQFEDRLRSSIEEIGLAEPIKVAPLPGGQYLVVDGAMRLRAIRAIRDKDPDVFKTIPAYVTDYECRFEIRYQTDIYQDLLPSQLAALVEHLHKAERVKKSDIARYIGVSPATLRNYTGLWRLLQRGGLFAKIVELMDVGVIPSSNPYAWLRLTGEGLKCVLKDSFCEGEPIDAWVEGRIAAARQGNTLRFTTNFVESATGCLDPRFYRQDEDSRSVKRDLGLRRAPDPQLFDVPATPSPRVKAEPHPRVKGNVKSAVRHLSNVSRESREPVLQTAARSLRKYLQ